MSRSTKRRHRLMYNFWLDINKPEEEVIADNIEHLKSSRSFAKSVRDGIRLICELKQGKTDFLFQLFPWLRAEITISQPQLEITNQPHVSVQLKRIEQLLREQQLGTPLQTAVSSMEHGSIKQLDVGSFAPPKFDEDDEPPSVTLRKASSSGGTATQNFLNSLQALQQ